jgi:hypothetical protein
MPQDVGFVDTQGRHFAIGQLYFHKTTFGKRQRMHGIGWKGKKTGEARIYDDLNVDTVAVGARTHNFERNCGLATVRNDATTHRQLESGPQAGLADCCHANAMGGSATDTNQVQNALG